MKIIFKSLKDGKVKLMPESLDDLWYLKGIISKGDFLSGNSARRIKDEGRTRADKGIRKKIFLEIEVDSVHFHPFITRLRVNGKIVKGPQDLISMGSYHTLDVKPRNKFTITKDKWFEWELNRINEAEKASKTPLILVVAVEEGDAEFGIIRRYGVSYPLRFTSHIPGKRLEQEYDAVIGSFNMELAEKLNEIVRREAVKVVIICGPGFTKDNFLAFLQKKNPQLANLCILESAGSGGKTGIQEIIKNGSIERIVKENRVSWETRLIEKIFKEISKNTGLAVYGFEEVKRAIEFGAIDKLLISEVKLRGNSLIEELMDSAKKKGGEIVVVSAEHESGERLIAISGIAGLCRFPLPE